MADALVRARWRPLSISVKQLVTLPLHGLVVWLYLWFASGGTFEFREAGFGHYYDLLADAFLAGQVHLTTTPSPELLALPDPYDPDQMGGCRCSVHDFSLYNGKYYLYFGPVPGVIHAAWKGLTRLSAPDSAMQVIFGLGGCLWFLLLARELRDRAFPRISDALVMLVYLCYALGGVGLYLQARPVVYHEAVLAATFFTLAGCYFWLHALLGGRYAGWQLAASGFLFGCGLGSRTTAFGYPLGAGVVLAWYWLRARERCPAARRLAAFGLPLGACVALLLLYNYARFGSFTDFGLTYQLNRTGGLTFDLRVFPYILATYVGFLPKFQPYYPFAMSDVGGGLVGGVRWWREPPFASTLLLAPLTILAPLAIGLLTPIWRRPEPVVRAFVVGGGIGVLCGLGTLLTWTWVTGRFMQDFLPISCLLGGLGLWWLQPQWRARRLRRLAYRTLGVTLLGTSLVAGLIYAMSELNQAYPEASLHLAYRFDSATAGLMQRVAPDTWPAGYFADEVRRRPEGVFYPEQSTLVLPAPTGTPIQSLEVESLFPDATLVAVEINGRPVAERRIFPGRQVLRLREAVTTGSTGRIAVRLRFPGQSPRPPGFLWPLRVSLVG